MKTVFYLGNIRSGSTFLTGLIHKNGVNVCCKHEPYPDMFGLPIYWESIGETDLIKQRFLKKKSRIENSKKENYIECNHAFLKSFSNIAMQFYPDMKLIRTIRNPLLVAKSAVNKKKLTHLLPWFFKYYKDISRKRYWRWMFTRKEAIFSTFKLNELTTFQYYILEWIEVENRAQMFLKQYNKFYDCFTLNVSEDLNDLIMLKNMFEFLEIDLRYNNIRFPIRKNTNHVKTIISDVERKEFQQIMNKIPQKYLEIFKNEPYINNSLNQLLQKKVIIKL